MSNKQLVVLVLVGVAVVKAVIWYKGRNEVIRKKQVVADNVAAVNHFESYGGGF